MKLSPLNVAIRELTEAPKIKLRLHDGDLEGFTFHVQKTPLLAELKAKFVDRGAETGLYVREDGFIMKESERPDDDL